MVSYKRHFLKLRNALADKSNIEFLTLTDKCHNPNYTSNAVKYKAKFFKEFTKRMKKKTLDKELHKAFLASYDWSAITEQDDAIWNKIFEFLK
jgi:hypothetical protein